jgi:hypothetical protein
MGVWSEGAYDVTKDLIFSFPVTIAKDGQFHIVRPCKACACVCRALYERCAHRPPRARAQVADFKWSEDTKKRIAITEQELVAERADAGL